MDGIDLRVRLGSQPMGVVSERTVHDESRTLGLDRNELCALLVQAGAIGTPPTLCRRSSPERPAPARLGITHCTSERYREIG